MQQRIINRVESDAHYKNVLAQNQPKPASTPTDAIITAAKQIADTIKAKSIVCFSLRGSTVLRAAKGRPGVPILGISPFKETARQLVMSCKFISIHIALVSCLVGPCLYAFVSNSFSYQFQGAFIQNFLKLEAIFRTLTRNKCLIMKIL